MTHEQLPRWRKIYENGKCTCIAGVYYDNYIIAVAEGRLDLLRSIEARLRSNAKLLGLV